MSLLVTFTGKVLLAKSGPDAEYQVWTYTVQSSQNDLATVPRIALAVPADIDVQDPRRYPNVAALSGAFLEHDANLSRQYVGKTLTTPAIGPQTISFVAPAGQTDREVLLAGGAGGRPWTVLPYATAAGGPVANVQTLPAPKAAPPVANGRPVNQFAGTLPYASEVFGVYQPLMGWRGRQNAQHFTAGALTPDELTAIADEHPLTDAVLSPVGLVNLFREYFFEFDTFLGTPAGHLWLSPGGTVELIETSTRRTLTEQTAEQSETTDRKVEESLTDQSDVADAVKESNANDTTLGAGASGGGGFAGIWHAEGSASFSNKTTTNHSSELTHKYTRTQSSKVSSEITRNFKTTFKTSTETTDTNSRRYVVQNTTDKLVNYELRRKMRKVGVQLQHLGNQLSWQVFLGLSTDAGGTLTGTAPGLHLGIGEMVSVVPAPDLTSVTKPAPQPIPGEKSVVYHLSVPFQQSHGGGPDNDLDYETEPENQDHGINKPVAGEANIIQFWFPNPLPDPPDGYQVSKIGLLDFHGADVRFVIDNPDHGKPNPDVAQNSFSIRLTHANFHGAMALPFDATIVYEPLSATVQAIKEANAAAQADYDRSVALILRQAYANAVADRLKTVSGVKPRPSEDLRNEERQAVYAQLIQKLESIVPDKHLASELIRQMFDVDQMLYFVAPDYWRPGASTGAAGATSLGRYEVPPAIWLPSDAPQYMNKNDPLLGETVLTWYSHTSSENKPGAIATNLGDGYDPGKPPSEQEYRVNYLITGSSQPAPMGSSLGWLIQTDGDARRNEFLNAAWVKAVLPIRPGFESAAYDWLTKAGVEGTENLTLTYDWQAGDPPEWRGKQIGEVLTLLAAELEAANTTMANTLATETVYQTGFDPLDGGFRPADPYQIFDQWVEVLPTDQVVAVEVTYDPKTGQQV
ncbi:hypothetical protein ABZ342_37715 [Amycolatopsis sp. NPDC005961]|uniref:hypothetical protein n=1 Tax=Amycolatopsis sp. NPDC005961 TaxID=3156720 RepID=UPI0033D6255A